MSGNPASAAASKPLFPILLAAVLALSAASGCSKGGDCSYRREGWLAPSDGVPELAVINKIRLEPDEKLTWNGVHVDRLTLRRYLRQTSSALDPLFVKLEIRSSSDCAVVESLMDDVDGHFGCRTGRCGVYVI